MRVTSSSSSFPSSCSLPCLHGCGHGSKATYAVVCLVFVAFLVVVTLDPRTQASWFLSSSSSPPPSSFSSLQPSARGSNGGGGGPLLATSSYFSSGGYDGKNSTGKEVLFQGDGGGELVVPLINSSSGHGAAASASASPASASASPAAEPTQAPAMAPGGGFGEAASSDDAIQVVPPMQRRDVKLERLELGLAKARSAIMDAIQNKDNRPPLIDKDYVPVGPVYRNAYAFHRYTAIYFSIWELPGNGEAVQGLRLRRRRAAGVPRRPVSQHILDGRQVHIRHGDGEPDAHERPGPRPCLLPPVQCCQDGEDDLRAGFARHGPAATDHLGLHRRAVEQVPVLEPEPRSGSLHALLPRLGAVRVVGGRAPLLQLHPRAVQRQHIGGVQPFQGRLAAGDQPPERRRGQAGRRAVGVPPPDPGLLRGRQPRSRPAAAPGALEGQGRGRAGERVPSPGRVVHRHDAAEQVLPVPQRVRGGEPEGGGGYLPGVRAGGDRRRLRAAVQRRAQLEGVLGAGGRGGHTGPEEDPGRRVAAAVHPDAAAGEGGAPALHGERPAAAVRRVPHDPALHLAQEAQCQDPWIIGLKDWFDSCCMVCVSSVNCEGLCRF